MIENINTAEINKNIRLQKFSTNVTSENVNYLYMGDTCSWFRMIQRQIFQLNSSLIHSSYNHPWITLNATLLDIGSTFRESRINLTYDNCLTDRLFVSPVKVNFKLLLYSTNYKYFNKIYHYIVI